MVGSQDLSLLDYNPYLEDYYKDIKRWSFPMEVFFLKERLRTCLR